MAFRCMYAKIKTNTKILVDDMCYANCEIAIICQFEHIVNVTNSRQYLSIEQYTFQFICRFLQTVEIFTLSLENTFFLYLLFNYNRDSSRCIEYKMCKVIWQKKRRKRTNIQCIWMFCHFIGKRKVKQIVWKWIVRHMDLWFFRFANSAITNVIRIGQTSLVKIMSTIEYNHFHFDWIWK